MNKKKHALISVFDKKNLFFICEILIKYNIALISTGSTAKEIRKIGFSCKVLSNLTKFPEMLGGRIKTLHPKIHASLLYDRNKKTHLATFKKLDFPIIDFVVVNLYPFGKVIKFSNDTKKCIEMIDIGGPTMLRSAAKNFKTLTTISSISDYKKFIKNMEKNKGRTSLDFREKMAQKVFLRMSKYDNIISKWFLKKKRINLSKNNKILLKYGENPHQKASYHLKNVKNSIFKAKIQGKDLGYNNILDLDSGLNCINEFDEPTCVIIKHNNPCGVASSNSIYNAFTKALAADTISAFGGIVCLNRHVDKKLATILSKNFYEVIAAKKFNKEALNILKIKKQLILIETLNFIPQYKKEIKIVFGGYLKQEKNLIKIKNKDLICVSKHKANLQTLEDLIFAFKVCKHVKSNAIVLAQNKQTIGIGAGQMSRVDSTKIAILKRKNNNNNRKFVAASDAFFPFTDNIKLLIKNKCHSIVQPKGSINDKKIIDFVNKKNISLYFSKHRLFKH